MANVVFTANLQRHVEAPPTNIPGKTVRDVLENTFRKNPRLKSYVVDEQCALRKHMIIFLDGEQIQDREHLSDTVEEDSTLYVMQALSGG